jgi:pimeloyl-ACP methyl ester carboxylesterase
MLKKLLFRDQLLEYEIKGAGLPVMLVHGFTEDRRIWDSLTIESGKQYLFIIPNLPGSGESEFNRSLYQLTDFAEALKTIADFENIPEMVLIGHSMGGYIALALAEKYPGLLLGLGLFHSSAYPDSDMKKEAREKNIRFILKNGAALFVGQAIPGLFSESFQSAYPEIIADLVKRYSNLSPETLVQYLEAMKQRPAGTKVLKTTTIPVMFIIGEEDKAVPMNDSLEQSHMPQIAHIHLLNHTAHMGMIENPALCKTFLEQFLTSIELRIAT